MGGRVLERRHPGPGRTLAARGTIRVGPASLYWVLPPQLMLKEQEALPEETVLEMVYGRGPPTRKRLHALPMGNKRTTPQVLFKSSATRS